MPTSSSAISRKPYLAPVESGGHWTPMARLPQMSVHLFLLYFLGLGPRRYLIPRARNFTQITID